MGEREVFHSGERAVQVRTGMRERIEQVGRVVIRDHMPEQHRTFFQQLPLLFVGCVDDQHRPWASVLVGRPGFVQSPDPRTLMIGALPLACDPLASRLGVGTTLGLLGIEFETRRRNRMNGPVTAIDARGFTVSVEQSFGNCPKYIQARTPTWISEPESFAARREVLPEGSSLSANARAMIERSDTFFIATAASSRPGSGGPPAESSADGVDVSHRGGKPGFVRVTENAAGTTLSVPDFVGNFLFNTLGNLVVNPLAGLLFVDFANGDLLGLTGEVEIVWDGPEVEAFPGAQRLLHFRVAEGWRVAGALPFRWTSPEFSPHLENTGPWNDAVAAVRTSRQETASDD